MISQSVIIRENNNIIFDLITLFPLSNKLIKVGITSLILISLTLFIFPAKLNNKQLIMHCWFFSFSFSNKILIESILLIKTLNTLLYNIIKWEQVFKEEVLISIYSQLSL